MKGASRWVDWGIAATVAVVMAFVIMGADETGTRDPDRVAVFFALTVAGLTFARHRYPLVALAATIAVLIIYYALNYPAFSPAVPLAVVAYGAAVAGRAVPAMVLLAVFLVFGLTYQVVEEQETLLSVFGAQTVADSALLAAVLSLGVAVRNRQTYREEVTRRLHGEAEGRVREERLRIARDLHDVLAHTVSALNVQAAVAADSLKANQPEDAARAVAAIRDQSRSAFGEVAATVALLRDGDGAAREPAPGLQRLSELVDSAGAAGVQVDLDVTGDTAIIPATVQLTAYRIVQESLTNVVRHAGARHASVRVYHAADELSVEVTDDGHGPRNGATVGGHGLAGMRERAAALGGTVAAGPSPGGGFRVRATLPGGGRT